MLQPLQSLKLRIDDKRYFEGAGDNNSISYRNRVRWEATQDPVLNFNRLFEYFIDPFAV
jgi:hypothetical protein